MYASLSQGVLSSTNHLAPDELLSHPAFSDYQLRVTEPNVCDPNVQQYSGYLDISESKHLFFWYDVDLLK